LFAFFVRPQSYEDRGRTYEFTHKTFSEYLIAQKLFRKLAELVQFEKRREGEKDRYRELLKKWAMVFGPSELGAISQFLKDGALSKRQPEIWAAQQLLARLIDEAVADGMPMQELISVCETFQEMVRQSKTAEKALLILHSCCGFATKMASATNWSRDPYELYGWLNWLEVHDRAPLNHMTFNNCRLYGYGPNYTGSHIYNCNFNWHQSACFDYTTIRGTLLGHDIIHECSFIGADISGTTINNARFDKSEVTLSQLRSTLGEPKSMPDGKPPWKNWRTRKPPKNRETEWTRAQFTTKSGSAGATPPT
jgi:hypothetical protein